MGSCNRGDRYTCPKHGSFRKDKVAILRVLIAAMALSGSSFTHGEWDDALDGLERICARIEDKPAVDDLLSRQPRLP